MSPMTSDIDSKGHAHGMRTRIAKFFSGLTPVQSKSRKTRMGKRDMGGLFDANPGQPV